MQAPRLQEGGERGLLLLEAASTRPRRTSRSKLSSGLRAVTIGPGCRLPFFTTRLACSGSIHPSGPFSPWHLKHFACRIGKTSFSKTGGGGSRASEQASPEATFADSSACKRARRASNIAVAKRVSEALASTKTGFEIVSRFSINTGLDSSYASHRPLSGGKQKCPKFISAAGDPTRELTVTTDLHLDLPQFFSGERILGTGDAVPSRNCASALTVLLLHQQDSSPG